MTPEQLAAFMAMTAPAQPASTTKSTYWLLLDANNTNMGNCFLKSQEHADTINAAFTKAKIKLRFQLPDKDFVAETNISI